MSRRAAAFTQADIHRALKAARMAQPGVDFAIEIGEGRARIVPVAASQPVESTPAPLAKKREWIP